SCARGGLGWTLGRISSQKRWLDSGMGCPGRWWSHRPQRCLRKDWTWHSVPWSEITLILFCFFFPDVSISVSSSLQSKENISLLGNRRLYFDTHALVCLLEANGFTTQQSEVIVSALVKIMNTNLDMIYKDMVTKVQQEIALQQVMSHIGGVKKDMIILEKSEFSALRSENEKIKLELQQMKKQVMDEITKVRADNKLNLNLEKSRVKELYSLNERKLLEMRTEIVELHAQQDRALTQTDRKIDTEVADLKTMLESHKLDNIKYLAGSVFTCLTVALGFYRLWI
uniref:Mitochondrial calcium uniporter regulator 1 n=1 Tax=Corvus moneduloides TaxID=1196302 RepID=A0A8C3GUE8_CORMO